MAALYKRGPKKTYKGGGSVLVGPFLRNVRPSSVLITVTMIPL